MLSLHLLCFAFWSKFSYGQRSKCADLRNSYLLFSIYSTSLRVPLYGLAPKDSLQLTGKDPPHSHAEFPRPDSADRSHGFQPVRQLRQVCIINQNLNYLSIFSTRLNSVCLGHNYRGGQCVLGPFWEFRAEGLSNLFCYTYHSVLLRRIPKSCIHLQTGSADSGLLLLHFDPGCSI